MADFTLCRFFLLRGGFLHSADAAVGMTYRGGSVLPTQVMIAAWHGDESSPLHCVVLFIYTGYIRNVSGGVFPPHRFYCFFTLPGFSALHGGGIMHPVNKKSKTKEKS